MLARAKRNRNGVVAVKVAFLLIPMVGLLALSIDYGFLLKERTDLQKAADVAALAAARELTPKADGTQDLAEVRRIARYYANLNVPNVSDLTITDADIEIGRYDRDTIYSSVDLLRTGCA